MRDWERDYGLAKGERFEPDELGEAFDPALPHAFTVLGPVDPGALGMTVFCHRIGEVVCGGEDDSGAVLGELEIAHYLGLRGLALTGTELSSDDNFRLRWIAERSPIHLVQTVSASQNAVVWWDEWSGGADDREFVIVDDLADQEPASLQRIDDAGASRILVGLRRTANDGSRRSLTDVLHASPLALMNHGYSAMDVRQILVENPAAVLTRTGGADDNRRNEP